MLTADDKGGMGSPAEERTGRKRAEAAGEARQRGETDPRRIETKRNISSSTYSLAFKLSIQNKKIHVILSLNVALQVSVCFVKCDFCFAHV